MPAIPALGVPISQSISLRVRKVVQGGRWIGIVSGVVLFALGVLAALNSDSFRFTWAASALVGGGMVSAVLGNLRKLSLSLVIGVFAVIAAINLALIGTSRRAIDYSVSARPAIEAAGIAWNDYSPEQSTAFKLTRSFQYNLNFYFHRELPEWSPDGSKPGWVFTSPKEAFELRNRGMNCPFGALGQAVIVCKDPGSANGSHDRRQPH